MRERILRYAHEDIDQVEIRFDWDVPHIIKSCFNSNDEVWSPATHVVILKDSAANNDLMATTCKDYLTRNWGDNWSQTLLRLLDRLTKEVLAVPTEASRAQALFPALRVSNLAVGLGVTATFLLGPVFGLGVGATVLATEIAKAARSAEKRAVVSESEIPNITGASIELFDSIVVLHFRSLSDVEQAMGFIEAWDWFCKAVRRPVPKGTILSNASYEFDLRERTDSKKALSISGHLSLGPSPEIDHCCWKELFQSCTLVISNLKPRIGFGKGLEMSFDLMLSLAAAEFQLIVDGGVVFIGYRTILFPTAVHGDSAQFHLLTASEGQINPYKQNYGSRILTEDATQFEKKRCFLGWCTNAQVNLGTKRLPISIKSSGGGDKETSLKLDGYAALMQAGASAPLAATLGLQTNYKYFSHRLRFTPASNYTQLLQDTAREVALVYDSGERRGWVVPKLSLLLHMGQAYASYRDYPSGQVPLVEPHSVAADLVTPLESLGGNRVSGYGEDVIQFRQLMLWLNTNLLEIPGLTKKSGGRKLYGFEFMDIIAKPGRGSCMKKLTLELAGKTWIEIANIVDAVVVCAQLGDAITAADEATARSEQCRKVPQGKDYLAATISCLKRLVERRGGTLDGELRAQLLQISRGSFWDLSRNPFSASDHRNCPGDCWQSADVFQHLTSPAPILFNQQRIFGKAQPASTAIPIPVFGAVVFGTPPKPP
ncbi:hypothetical protein IFM61392_10584 [Aspergillus lentulus]|nr:hypothetical protein IFM61392_10584 [Aspergillus lentulus]